MGRTATGTVRILNGEDGKPVWHGRWTRADGTRSEWLPLPGRISLDDEAGAKACAARMAPKVRAASVNNGGEGETVGKWFARLHAAKEAKGLATVGDMRGRARNWILPGIEQKTMRDGSLSIEDGERIVTRLDRAVAEFAKKGPGEGRLSPSTARNVWGDAMHALDEAVRSKDASLRVLTANPWRDVRGPDSGEEREGQILYSDELLALLRGIPVDPDAPPVPLYRRQCYAMAAYTKARASELEALTASDIDLAHGTITIDKQSDRKSKGRAKTKATKTKRVRVIDVEPHLRPLLEHLVAHPAGKKSRLLHMPRPEDRAEQLRRDLVHVGVTRKALHIEGDPLRRSILFHDLRDTGLTHMAVRGDAPIAIQWAGGHSDFKTTQGYIDRGRVEARRIGAPLPPLPSDLVGDESPRIAPGAISSRNSVTNKALSASPTGFDTLGNPGFPAENPPSAPSRAGFLLSFPVRYVA